jgi:hypothetical protein
VRELASFGDYNLEWVSLKAGSGLLAWFRALRSASVYELRSPNGLVARFTAPDAVSAECETSDSRYTFTILAQGVPNRVAILKESETVGTFVPKGPEGFLGVFRSSITGRNRVILNGEEYWFDAQTLRSVVTQADVWSLITSAGQPVATYNRETGRLHLSRSDVPLADRFLLVMTGIYVSHLYSAMNGGNS